MQLKDIEYVAMLASEKNFSAAAAKLFISQPTLSQAIKRLENELNVPLFKRSTNSVNLTSAGELFLADGIEILRQSRQLKKRMEDIVNLKEGQLNLGISTFYSSYYLARIIPVYRTLHPGLKLGIKEDISIKLEEYALDGTVDISMVPLPLTHKELEVRILQQEQILFAIPPNSHLTNKLTSPPSAGYPFIDLSLAKDEPFVYLQNNQRFASMGIELCQRAGFYPKIAYEITNWDAINTLIGCGTGVGFVPEIVCERTLSNTPVPVYCRILGESAVRPYAVVFRKDKLKSPLIKNFINSLTAIFHQRNKS